MLIFPQTPNESNDEMTGARQKAKIDPLSVGIFPFSPFPPNVFHPGQWRNIKHLPLIFVFISISSRNDGPAK